MSKPKRSPARFDNDDEENPLLRAADSDDAPHRPTPLPTTQILVLILPWIAEAIVSYSISPYINQV